MVATVNELGVLQIQFARVDNSGGLPTWNWRVEFNTYNFVDIDCEGKTVALKALCTLDQLESFLERNPDFSSLFDQIRINWNKSYPLPTIREKYKQQILNKE